MTILVAETKPEATLASLEESPEAMAGSLEDEAMAATDLEKQTEPTIEKALTMFIKKLMRIFARATIIVLGRELMMN